MAPLLVSCTCLCVCAFRPVSQSDVERVVSLDVM